MFAGWRAGNPDIRVGSRVEYQPGGSHSGVRRDVFTAYVTGLDGRYADIQPEDGGPVQCVFISKLTLLPSPEEIAERAKQIRRDKGEPVDTITEDE